MLFTNELFPETVIAGKFVPARRTKDVMAKKAVAHADQVKVSLSFHSLFLVHLRV